MFLRVFNNSLDKKTSAYTSYTFCTYRGAEGKKYFTNIQDQITYLTLKGIRDFSDDNSTLNEMYNLAPQDEKMELLFIRALNNLERVVWPSTNGMKTTTLPNINEQKKERIKALKDFSFKTYSHAKVTHKDFWLIANSYLHFILGENDLAKQKLNLVKNKKYNPQKTLLTKVYEVFSWDDITPAHEEFLAANFGENIHDFRKYYSPRWPHLIMDQVAHLYYKKGELAKAYLMHNDLQKISAISSHLLIDNLLAFAEKPNKNQLEQYLVPERKLCFF